MAIKWNFDPWREGTFVLSAVIGVLLILALPEHALAHSPLLQSFTDLMATAIPSIDYLTNISIFPEVTRLFLSLMWLFVPFQTAAFLFQSSAIQFDIDKVRKQKVFYYGGAVFIVLVFIVLWSVMGSTEDPILSRESDRDLFFFEKWIYAIKYSKLMLGVVGSLLLAATAFSFAYFIKLIVSTPKRDIAIVTGDKK